MHNIVALYMLLRLRLRHTRPDLCLIKRHKRSSNSEFPHLPHSACLIYSPHLIGSTTSAANSSIHPSTTTRPSILITHVVATERAFHIHTSLACSATPERHLGVSFVRSTPSDCFVQRLCWGRRRSRAYNLPERNKYWMVGAHWRTGFFCLLFQATSTLLDEGKKEIGSI